MVGVTRAQSNIKILEKALDQLGRKGVAVGFFDTAHYPDGTPVAYVAAIQEFGSPQNNIPPRSFMRSTASEKSEGWSKTLAQGANRVMAGKMDAEQMLGQFGLMVAGDIKSKIVEITSPALKSSTMSARRSRKADKNPSSKPLVDTGLMLASVESKVIDQ